ncbi:MAG: chemotaxis protein CheW [Nannocystaceae bacterium]|nr:chemotaxis protein CheW [Nannocystaceae bacterium]
MVPSDSHDTFIDETSEHLSRIEALLASVDPSEADCGEEVNELFRALHTIKGGAGLLELPNMRLVAHVAETVLDAVRKGARPLDDNAVHALLRARDVLADMLEDLARESDVDASAAIAALEACLDTKPAALIDPEDCGFVIFADEPDSDEAEDPAVEEAASNSGPPVVTPAADSSPSQKPPTERPSVAEPGRGDASRVRANESVRVPLWVLDRLMTLAGELVLVRNRTRQNFEHRLQRDRELASSPDRRLLQQLDLVTGELQENILRTRMQPVSKVLSKVPKLCRDLSVRLDKQIEPMIIGAEVEVDKTILECLSDPLLHLIRNACDHGVESPEKRLASGKPEQGTVSVQAQQESGQISLTITDDGAGIDTARVASLAVERGIRTSADVAGMTDRQVCALVFAPGFSTAAEVTDVSGRGVGMDVVRTAIESVGGTVDVESVQGKGTTFTLRLPLSLAIVPSLIVRDGAETFAIPHVNLEEVIRRHRDEDAIRISYINELPVIRVRGSIVPIVELGDVLAGPGEIRARKGKTDERETLTIAVVRVSKMRFGIIVDEAIGSEEVVVKPNHPLLGEQRCFVGSTILGDGRVALILDANGICELAGLPRRFTEHTDESDGASSKSRSSQHLLFTVTGDDRYLVPLTLVSRLVPIEPSQLRVAGGVTTVELPDGNLRVVRLDRHLGVEEDSEPDSDLILILPRHLDLPVGFLAAKVVDIVSLVQEVSQVIHRSRHILGSTTVDGAPALILDLAGLARAEEPSWFEGDAPSDSANAGPVGAPDATPSLPIASF